MKRFKSFSAAFGGDAAQVENREPEKVRVSWAREALDRKAREDAADAAFAASYTPEGVLAEASGVRAKYAALFAAYGLLVQAMEAEAERLGAASDKRRLEAAGEAARLVEGSRLPKFTPTEGVKALHAAVVEARQEVDRTRFALPEGCRMNGPDASVVGQIARDGGPVEKVAHYFSARAWTESNPEAWFDTKACESDPWATTGRELAELCVGSVWYAARAAYGRALRAWAEALVGEAKAIAAFHGACDLTRWVGTREDIRTCGCNSCSFRDADEQELAALRAAGAVTLRGRFNGGDAMVVARGGRIVHEARVWACQWWDDAPSWAAFVPAEDAVVIDGDADRTADWYRSAGLSASASVISAAEKSYATASGARRRAIAARQVMELYGQYSPIIWRLRLGRGWGSAPSVAAAIIAGLEARDGGPYYARGAWRADGLSCPRAAFAAEAVKAIKRYVLSM